MRATVRSVILALALAAFFVVPLSAAQPPSGFPPPGNGTFGNFSPGGPREDPVSTAFKVIHVASGVAWVGAVLFLFVVLGPAIKQAATDPAFLHTLASRSRIGVYMPIASILTVATGAIMYWGMKDRLLSTSTTSLLVFNLGVLCGLVAFAHGAWFQNRLLRSIRNSENGQATDLQDVARRLHLHDAISAVLLVATTMAMAKGPL